MERGILLRVIAGKYKGVRLNGPQNSNTRPTSDRVKEALFSILTHDLQDAEVLDLFAGTGGIGIEALSRNASKVVFVDFDKNALRILKENLSKTRAEGNHFEIFCSEARQAVDRLSSRGNVFDIIFLDPPYAMEDIASLMEKIIDKEIIAKYGKIIVEHDKRKEMPESLRGFKKKSARKYGNTVLSIYGMEEEA